MLDLWLQRVARALAIVTLSHSCWLSGCDYSPQPGQELFDLKNPTRRWKVPTVTAVSLGDVPKLPAPRANLDFGLAVDPPAFEAPRARPDRPTEMVVLVSSQRWDQFELTNLASSLPGLTWKLEPAEQGLLARFSAKSGWYIRTTLPANLPSGELQGKSLTLEAVSSADERDIRRLEIPIHAKVLRRIAVYGQGIDERGTINFGVLPVGVEHQRKLTVKVNDPLSRLYVTNIAVSPDYLQASLKPIGRDGDNTGNLYRLEVALPATAPVSVHQGERLGTIKLEFDHPRISALTLHADFVLSGKDRHPVADQPTSL